MVALESKSPKVRANAAARVQARHQVADIPAIIAIVNKYLADDTRRDTVRDNMLLLGKLRAVEAIPLLLDNLTYDVFYKETKRLQSVEDLYPAVQALIDIGRPSLGPVQAKLSSGGDEILAKNGTTVLKGILGHEGARDLLTAQAAAAADEAARVRLNRLIAVLEEV